MAPVKQKNNSAKRKRKKRKVYFEPEYLRESLGFKDLSAELERAPNPGKKITGAETFGDKRVSFQPEIVEEDAPKRQKNSSRRFKRFWASLTKAQKEALKMVYVKNPNRLTKVEVARKLGIRVDTLQERIYYAIKKLRRFFPEFGE